MHHDYTGVLVTVLEVGPWGWGAILLIPDGPFQSLVDATATAKALQYDWFTYEEELYVARAFGMASFDGR